MKRLVLALILAAAAAVPALAADPAVDAFKQKFAPQEQILLGIVLAEPSAAAQFAQDAHKQADPTLMAAWRTRIAVASRDYLATSHPTNEKATTVQGMVEPGEWAALMISLKMLANGGLTDQAKFKIFLAMIDDANDGLKEGDTAAAHRVIKMARPKLTEAMNEWLATAEGKQALAGAAAAEEAAKRERERLAREKEQRDREQAERDRQEAERKKTQPATTQPATTQPSTQPVVKKPAKPVIKDKTSEASTGGGPTGGTALDQAKKAAGEGSAEQTFDGAGSAKELPVTTIPPVETTVPAASSSGLLPSSGGSVPNLAVIPPSPSQGDDLAELRQMKKKVSGSKKWYAAGGGALLGGLLGFLFGGPVGALIGAALGGGAGFLAGRHLWG